MRPTSARMQVDLDAKGSSVIAGHRHAALPLSRRRARRALREELARRPGRAACARRRRHALPAGAGRVSAPAGRGARTLLDAPDGHILLIDESYNANPASMRAALAAMATTPRADFPRRIAVLGDMLELGEAAPELHRGAQGSG